MKHLIALALFLTIGAAAQAKPTPVDPQPAAILADDLTISTGPTSATLEQDYFRAVQPADATGPTFLCRPQRLIFDKTRLAQLCR